MSAQDVAESFGTDASDITLHESILEFEELSEEEQTEILLRRL